MSSSTALGVKTTSTPVSVRGATIPSRGDKEKCGPNVSSFHLRSRASKKKREESSTSERDSAADTNVTIKDSV